MIKQSGIIEYPIKMHQEIYNRILKIRDYKRDGLLKSNIVEFSANMDFSGTKYESLESAFYEKAKEQYKKSLKIYRKNIGNPTQEIKDEIKKTVEKYSKVKIRLIFTYEQINSGYTDANNTIDLYWWIRHTPEHISDILKHELIHYMQKCIKFVTGNEMAGNPPLDTLTPEYSQFKKGRTVEEHDLDDTEFYPLLIDFWEFFINKADVKRALDDRQTILNILKDEIVKDEWLNLLKDKAPQKYEKAIKEIYKLTNNVIKDKIKLI